VPLSTPSCMKKKILFVERVNSENGRRMLICDGRELHVHSIYILISEGNLLNHACSSMIFMRKDYCVACMRSSKLGCQKIFA